MPGDELSSAAIRALRGARTRAAFAAELGVNAHTVYRWELADGSPAARRPRGAALARLRSVAAKAGNAAAADDAATPVSAAVQRLLDGSWREAEGALLRALGDRATGAEARVLASTGLALIDLMYRADGRRALAALGPALAPGAPPSALTEAAAALAYSYPDGELFDPGVVHAHARRAEELARGGEAPVALALAAMAEANAALLASDDDLLVRALAGVEAIAGAALPEIPAMFLEQLRSLDATMAGQPRLAMDRLDRLLANPRLAASPVLEARVCAMRAMRLLDDLGDPGVALDLVRRARAAADGAHLAVGVHTALVLRAEAEACVRLGRLDDAAAVFREADRIFVERGFPVTIVFPVQARYLLATGQEGALVALAARVAAVELPSMRAICQAYAAWLTATATLLRGDDARATMAAYAHAERLASGWGLMRRDLLVSYAGAALIDGTAEEAREVLGRARRAAERRPAAWVTAHLRRVEGTLLLDLGRIEEGRTLFDAALATFEASNDRLDAALARFGSAGLRRLLGEPDADRAVALAEAELAALGLPRPSWIERALARTREALASGPRPRAAVAGASITPALELALQRITVAGATTAMVMRELAAAAPGVAGVPVVLEEDDAAARPDVAAWFEVGGGGHSVRLGVGEVPADEVRAAMRVLALVAGLALEVASLRGGERTAAASDPAPQLPGLVAASPPMRRLLADVARLAASRATVVITGESGAGKEVVARALHDLSPRAPRPYVAFNCAAVPRDLFEGQLFGYRKGAFTGAAADHAGVVRAADGGTLFLDEIGELPLDIQPKLLRFLDSGEIQPLGAPRPITVDVRVIAATNRDLGTEVARGRFREDLYYRLHVVPLVVPPLRDRKDDIVPLARHFARQLAPDGHAPAFAPDALAALRAHRWPGNARELKNVITRAMAYAPAPVLLTRAQLGV